MQPTSREKDKRLVPLAVVVARHGHTVADLMEAGAPVVTRAQGMDGTAEMIQGVQVEATFPEGTKLVAGHEPIR